MVTKSLMLLALCVATGTALPVWPFFHHDDEWESFKLTYSKVYSVHEEAFRRHTWEQHVRDINAHNQEADKGVHTYWLGINVYGDMAHEEFLRVMTGHKYDATDGRRKQGKVHVASSRAPLPAMVDWSQKGYVTPVKDQGQCGSCWAFASTGSLEGQHFKKTGQLVSLSEQNLVDCSRKQGNKGCDGGLMDQAFTYIKANNGIDTEASYPYDARDGRCRFQKSTVGATLTGFVNIPSKNEAALQNAVATVGPIAVAIDASHRTFQFYKSGVYNEPACSQTQLDHGVLAIGYGTSGSTPYWLVKNSWGTSWGNNGFLMMSRNQNNQCGIATDATYPTV